MKFVAKAIAIVSPILLWILLYEKMPFSIDIPFSRLTLSEIEGKTLNLIAAINTGIMAHRMEFTALAYAFIGLVVFCFILLMFRTNRSATKPSNEFSFEASNKRSFEPSNERSLEASNERTAEALAKRTSLREFMVSAIAFCSSVVFGFAQLVIRTIRSGVKAFNERIVEALPERTSLRKFTASAIAFCRSAVFGFTQLVTRTIKSAVKASNARIVEESDECTVEESDQPIVEALAKRTVVSSVDLTSVMESLGRLSEAIREGRINKPSVDLIIREAYLRQIAGENVDYKSNLESMNDW